MNKRIYKIFSILIIVFVGFMLDVKPVFAISCEYKMISPLYYISNQELNITTKSTACSIKDHTIDTLNYSVDGSKYTLRDDYRNPFTDRTFHKEVSSSGKCPEYIYANNGTMTGRNAEIVKDKEKFWSYQRTYLKNYDCEKQPGVPMFLYNENGKTVTNPYNNAVNKTFDDYVTYLDTYESRIKTNCKVDNIVKLVNYTYYDKTREQFLTYVSGYYDNTQKLSKDSNISAACWNARRDYVKAVLYANEYEILAGKIGNIQPLAKRQSLDDHILKATHPYEEIKEKEESEENLEYFGNNYCAMYCETMKCKDMENSAQTACINACTPSNDCTKALSNCSNITSETVKQTCMKSNMSDYQEYDSIYNAKIKELEEKIEEINGRMYVNISKVNSLILDTIDYEITCEDVEKLHTAWMILWISAPVILIVMGTVDYFRAVISSDQEKMNKVRKKFPKRFIALLILILTPLLISIIVTVLNIGETANAKLISCVVNGGD